MTSEAKERPNFNIIEGHSVELDYGEFKDDFLNPYFLAKDVRKKYGLSIKQYTIYREQVLNETGLTRKPTKNQYRILEELPSDFKHFCTQHISECNGLYIIRKSINYSMKYYGRYEDYDTAVMVRDKLIECNWDDEVAKDLKTIYGKKRLFPALEKAKEVYDEFEYRYFYDRDTNIEDILREMDLTRRTYSYLMKMLRANHNGKVRRNMYD